MSDPIPDQTDTEHGHSEIMPEYRAKQGRRGLHMLGVLIASLALILVAFGTLYGLNAHTPRDEAPATAAANAHTMAS